MPVYSPDTDQPAFIQINAVRFHASSYFGQRITFLLQHRVRLPASTEQQPLVALAYQNPGMYVRQESCSEVAALAGLAALAGDFFNRPVSAFASIGLTASGTVTTLA